MIALLTHRSWVRKFGLMPQLLFCQDVGNYSKSQKLRCNALKTVRSHSRGKLVSDSAEVQQDQTIGLSLHRNFSWTFLGNVIYSGCQWGVLVVLAKLGSPEIVGRFALAFAVTAPVVMFANLQLSNVEATDAKCDYNFSEYLALRLATAALALLAIIGITLLSGYNWQVAAVVLTVGLAKTLESISDIYYGFLQQHERMDRIGISMLIKGPLSLAALTTAFYYTKNLFLSTAVLALVWGAMLAFYDLRSAALIMKTLVQERELSSALTPSWNKDKMHKLTKFSLPLGITMMLVSLNANIPRYFVEHHLGQASLGIFAAMSQLMMFGNTVMGALGQSASPQLAKRYSQARLHDYLSLLAKLLGMGAIIGGIGVLVAAFAGPWVLGLIYGKEYQLHASVFLWIAVASGVSYVQWFLGCSMTAARYFKVQVPLLATVSVVTTAVCWWLIPSGGLLGAAYAILTATIVLASGSLAVNLHAFRHIDKQKNDS